MTPPHRSSTRRLLQLTAGIIVAAGFGSQALAGTVTGTVKDSVTNAVISGVKVMVTQQTSRYANTNTSGVYSITSVTAGTVTLTASKTGYITQVTGNVVVPSSGTVTAPLILLVKAGTITGTVVNSSGGAVVSGATVKVTGTSTSTTTNSSGVFTLYQATGSYTLTVSLTGWVTATTGSFSVTNNQTTDVGSIPFTQTATVTGTVKESGTGTVLASVSVKLHSNTAKTATTNSSGVFTLTGVPVGTQSLDLSKTGYVSQTTASFAVAAGTNNVGDLLLVKSTGNIAGVVQDAQAGNAGLPGATVTVNSVTPTISATTAADGSYTLSGVPVGTRTVNAAMTGYTARNTSNITVTQGQTATAASLALTRTTVSIAGTVTDRATTAAISGATVSVQEQSGKNTTTSSSGAYTLTGVYWGNVHLNASKSNYTTKTTPVTLTAGTNATQGFALDSAFGTLTGEIDDASTGLGLPDVTVALTDDPSHATGVDGFGQFTLENVPVGAHTLTVTRDRYVTVISDAINVIGGANTVPAIALTPMTVSISGLIRDASTGDPVAGATITAARTGQTVTSDGSGVFTIAGLQPGAELLAYNASGFEPMTNGVVYLNPGDAFTDWAIDMYPPGDRLMGVVQGTVRDSSGVPLPGATVGVVGGPTTTTGEDGTYSIPAHGGRLSIVASKPGYRTIFTPDHADWPGGAPAPWQIHQDFTLATVTELSSLAVTAHDPALRTLRESDFTVYTPTAAYRILVPSSGTRTVSNLPPGPLFGLAVPLMLAPGATVPIDVNGPVTLPGTSPDWVAFGTVVRDTTKAPVAGVTVTLANDGASFTTTVTTDDNGRWSFSNGPTGDYSVTYVGPDGLTRPEPWRFTATEDGWWGETTYLLAPGDTGSITCTNPASGLTLTTDLTRIDCTAVLPRANDYLVMARAFLSNGHVESQTTTYDLDGKAFHIDLVSASRGGPQDVQVNAIGRFYGWLDLSIPVVMQPALGPMQVVLNPPEVTGGTQLSGTVILNAPAPAGGLLVTLASDNTSVATVPATVTVGEGSDNAGFPVGTALRTTAASATISATANGVSRSATLAVTPSTAGTIAGQVVDAVTGVGLSEVTVTLADEPSIATGVDWEGRFALFSVPPGSHTLTATRNDYADATTEGIVVVAAELTQVPAINLTPNPVTIQGHLVPVGSGLGLAGATITAARSGQSTVTNDSGNFTLSGLAPGYELLTATRDGFAPSASNEIPLYPGQTVEVGMDIFDGSRPSGVVHGTVRDSAGAAVSDATVAIVGGLSVQTQADGSYTMTVPGGRYVLRATKDGYRTQVSRNHADAPLWQASWQVQQDFVLYTPAETGVVELTTADAFTRLPNQGRVSLQGLYGAYWADTSPQGQRTLPSVPAGQLLGWATPRSLTPGAVLELAFNAGATLPDTSPRWGAYGIAYRATTGEPIPDATVELTNAGAAFTTTVTTDSRGRWSFTGGPLGPYGVTASAEGGLTSDGRFDFTPEDNGGIWGWNAAMAAPSDAGALTIDSPVPGAVLPGGLTSVSCTGTFPRQGDYITSAWVNLSQGQVQSQTAVYDIDGRHFRIDVTAAVADGPLTVTVRARTWYGKELAASTDVMVGTPSAPLAISMNPPSVVSGATSTGTVVLGSPAGAGGVSVGLASSAPAVATMPPTAVVPQGVWSTQFVVTTSPVTTATPVTISATTADASATSILTVHPLVVTSVSFNPAVVLPGGSSVGTVTLNGAAPAGGVTIGLTNSRPDAASIPTTVVVTEGSTDAHFSVTTVSTIGPTLCEVTATTGGSSASATLAVGAGSFVASVTFDPASLRGGESGIVTVELSQAAPSEGLQVTLSSSDAVALTMPASLMIPGGATSGHVNVSATNANGSTSVIVTASGGGAAATAALSITPITLTGFDWSMGPITASGRSATYTTTLSAPAPATGLYVSFTCDHPAIVPLTLAWLSPGKQSATFMTNVGPVGSETAVTVCASAGGDTNCVTFLLQPMGLAGVAIAGSVWGGDIISGNVILNSPAPSGGTTVSLTTSVPGVTTLPAAVTVHEGSTTASFSVTTLNPGAPTPVVITASANGLTATGTFTINPIAVTGISVAGGDHVGSGALLNIWVYINVEVPPHAREPQITLTSDNPAVLPLPAVTTVYPYWQSCTVVTYSGYVSAPTPVTITASCGGATVSTIVTVEPLMVQKIQLEDPALENGELRANNQICLNGAAPAGGVTVTLTSASPQVSVPATVTIDSGSHCANFPITNALPVCTETPVTISAALGSETATVDLIVTPTKPNRVLLNADTVIGGQSTTVSFRFKGWLNPLECAEVISTSNPSVAWFNQSHIGRPTAQICSFNASTYEQVCPVPVWTSRVPTTTPVTISIASGGVTKTATLTVQSADVTGVAPGWVLPGDGAVAYGRDFQVGTSVELLGPVYDLGVYTNPKCTVAGGSCAVTSLDATPNAAGDALSFAVPPSVAPGVYALRTRTQAGSTSNVTLWFAVDQAPITVPALTAEQHKYARAIHSGQTVTGTFVANGDTSGVSSDYNYFYFIATAGSTIDASLERVDTSKPWEHPDSLDPEIEIVGPDGFVPQNLVALDNQPGVDLNASLHGAVLPLTGTYVLRAATSRGFGDYRLHFAVTAMAAPAADERIIPFMDAYATVPVNEATTPTAIVLDPRGYQLSGAQMTLATTPQPGDSGQVEFAATALTSSPDGSVQATATARAAGKVTFAPAFLDTFTSSVLRMTGVAVSAQVPAGVPRYQSVARQTFAVTGLFEGDWVGLSTGAFERLPAERHTGRREVRGDGRASQSAGLSTGHLKPGSGVAATGTQLADHGPLTTDDDLDPLDASTAVPLREIEPQGMTATAQAITSCGSATFTQLNVPAGTVLHPPLVATLTDLTPPVTGGPAAGEVGIDGIHGHRIEKTARLKLSIKDATGQEPTYPVLVQLAMGGPRHGQVILDPDGNRIACDTAAFIWHERDSQGTLIAANEEFEIGMGTSAAYAGVAPDPVTPGQVVPVWGTAELLNLSAQAKVQIDGAWADPLLMSYNVHPEPGRPDHFFSADNLGHREDNIFEYWSRYALELTAGGGFRSSSRTDNAYLLGDRFENVVFGQRDSSASAAASNVSVEFADQTTAGPDFAAYSLRTAWTDVGGLPQGDVPATISLSYPADPAGDWGSGTVTQAVTLRFAGGPDQSMHAIRAWSNYDHARRDWDAATDAWYGPEDGAFPMTVSPAAGPGALPTTTDGDTPRLVLLLLTGTIVESPMGTPWPEPHATGWSANGDGTFNHSVAPPHDPNLEVGDAEAFRISLLAPGGAVAKDAIFRVHRCPRFDHEGPVPPAANYSRTCTLAPLDSTDGVIDSVVPNPQGSTDGRGYLGIELLRAPTAPGSYYVYVESRNRTYRLKDAAEVLRDLTPDGVYSGGWWLCTVMGGEILDENFQRVEPMVVRQATQAYVRLIDPTASASTQDLTVHSFDDTGAELGTGISMTAARVGTSAVFLGPFTLLPDGDELPSSGSTALLPGGNSDLKVRRGADDVADAKPKVPLRLRIDFVDPSGAPVPEQYTVIEGQEHNYAEKTYLKVSVVNPHRLSEGPKNVTPCALLREIPMDGTGQSSPWPAQVPPLIFTAHHDNDQNPYDNNVSNGGDSLEEPGFSVGLRGGVSEARAGEADPIFFLRAVARRRQDSSKRPLLDFAASVYATACPSTAIVDDSNTGGMPPMQLDMWVDQADYFPHTDPPIQPTRHPERRGSAKLSIDWVEKEALDVLTTPSSDEQQAFGSVFAVYTDGYDSGNPNSGAWTGLVQHGCPYTAFDSDPFLNHAVHVNPVTLGLRWGMGAETGQTAWMVSAAPSAGLVYNFGPGRTDLFELVISHEARHSLQKKISMDCSASNDEDMDQFVRSLTENGFTLLNGERLLDAASVLPPESGTNPEFHLHGDDPLTVALDCWSTRGAVERDAYLHQRSSTYVRFQLAGAGPVEERSSRACERVPLLVPIVLEPDPVTSPHDAYAFDGNIAIARVVSGGCSVDDGAGAPAAEAVIHARYQVPYFQLMVTAPNSPGTTCSVLLTPYLPTDSQGLPLNGGAPLTAGPQQLISIAVTP